MEHRPDEHAAPGNGNVWHAMPTEGSSSAAAVGPFPYRSFLAAVERAIGTPDDAIHVCVADDAAVALVDDDEVRFAGPAHLTDYHALIGAGPNVLAEGLTEFGGRRFVLDSLPEEELAVVVAAVESIGADHEISPDESTAVLDLPSTYDDWLMSIGKKERHEVRRKRRRFEAEFGDITVVRESADAVREFCELHRTSPGEKGSFMTASMERLFVDLATDAGASVHRLVCDGRTRAAAFGFETDEGYFYYNSAYDPDAAMASPGVVLLSAMIEDQIARGVAVFDFLKGEERYKYRHGARRRPLARVEGTIP